MRLPTSLTRLSESDAVALLHEWIQLVPNAVVFLDTRTNKISFANHEADRLLCKRSEHIVGQTRAWCLRRGIFDKKTLAGLDPGDMARVHFAPNVAEHELKRGKTALVVRTRYHPVVIAGEPHGILATFEDLTEEHHTRQLRDDVMQMMFHDMKHPLNAIALNLDGLIVLAEQDLTDQQLSFIATAKSKVGQLQRMFATMLDIGELEEGALTLSRQELDMNALVEGVLRDTFALQFDAAGKRLMFSPSAHLIPVQADAALMRRVIENLLDNALKFTKAGGTVDVRTALGPDRHSVRVVVRDQGPGIPAKHRLVIFEKYRQVQLRRAGTKTGIGLGLAFCRLALDAHGGDVWVERVRSGGSDFCFSLPAHPPATG